MTLADVDAELSECYQIMGETEMPLDLDIAFSLMRKAYGHGYLEALRHPDPDVGAAGMLLLEVTARLPVL